MIVFLISYVIGLIIGLIIVMTILPILSESSQVFSGEAEDKIVSLIQENINHRMFYVTSEIKKLTEEQSKLYVIIDLISDFKEGEATNGL